MRFLVAVLLAAGCIVGDVGPTPGPTGGGTNGSGSNGSGSNGSGSNGSGMNGNSMPDAGTSGGPKCTGAAYDPCTGPTQCLSGKCQLFTGSGFQVCTQACTPGNNATCPAQNGVAAT